MKELLMKVPVGLHAEDGVEMELFTSQLLALRLRGQSSERVRTSLLTREQAVRLRDALDQMIEALTPDAPAGTEDEGARRLRAA